MGTNHCTVRLSLNSLYNLFSESFFFDLRHRLRLIKRVDVMEKDGDKVIYLGCLQVNKFSVYEDVKKFPRAEGAHICAKTQMRSFCLGDQFTGNIQSRREAPHSDAFNK